MYFGKTRLFATSNLPFCSSEKDAPLPSAFGRAVHLNVLARGLHVVSQDGIDVFCHLFPLKLVWSLPLSAAHCHGVQQLVRHNVLDVFVVDNVRGYADDKIKGQFWVDRFSALETIALAPAVARIRA